MVVQLQRRQQAGLGVIVVSEQDGVRGEVIVRRELRLDVRRRNIAAEAEIQAVGDAGEVQLAVILERIPPVKPVVLQQLVAEVPAGRGVAVVDAVKVGDPETPIDVIGLYCIRLALEA